MIYYYTRLSATVDYFFQVKICQLQKEGEITEILPPQVSHRLLHRTKRSTVLKTGHYIASEFLAVIFGTKKPDQCFFVQVNGHSHHPFVDELIIGGLPEKVNPLFGKLFVEEVVLNGSGGVTVGFRFPELGQALIALLIVDGGEPVLRGSVTLSGHPLELSFRDLSGETGHFGTPFWLMSLL